jgi:hypothetical protein
MPAVIVMTVMKTVLMITRKKKIMTDIPPNIVRVMPISSVGERELRERNDLGVLYHSTGTLFIRALYYSAPRVERLMLKH